MNFVVPRSSTWKTIGQVAVGSEALQVQPRDAAQARFRVQPLECRPALGDGRSHRALEDRHEQVVLAPEIEINGARRDAGGPGDISHLCVEETVARERLDGGGQDSFPLVLRGTDAG